MICPHCGKPSGVPVDEEAALDAAVVLSQAAPPPPKPVRTEVPFDRVVPPERADGELPRAIVVPKRST